MWLGTFSGQIEDRYRVRDFRVDRVRERERAVFVEMVLETSSCARNDCVQDLERQSLGACFRDTLHHDDLQQIGLSKEYTVLSLKSVTSTQITRKLQEIKNLFGTWNSSWEFARWVFVETVRGQNWKSKIPKEFLKWIYFRNGTEMWTKSNWIEDKHEGNDTEFVKTDFGAV